MNIVFVNYGASGNNSSYHIRGFASRLAERGHRVAVIAQGPEGPQMAGLLTVDTGEVVEQKSRDVGTLLSDENTVVHAWTPREAVRQVVEPLAAAGLRYLVHLEDDEALVASSQLGLRPGERPGSGASCGEPMRRYSDQLTASRRFLQDAAAVTLIAEGLAAEVPKDTPWRLLEPGVDTDTFGPVLSEQERSERRSALGYGPADTLIVYHGNVHPAIQRDVFSLYTAVRMLRRQGLAVHLLRTGMSEQVTTMSSDYRRADGVRHLGCVPRDEMPGLLDLADLYIQPGWINPFNEHRLPSKLLEFLAMGRPVILSKVNLGARLQDGRDAVVVPRGGAPALVDAVRRLLSDPDRARRIGAAGRDYVKANFSWTDKVDQLERFYRRALNVH